MTMKHGKDNIGDRIKAYESCAKTQLIKRIPVIVRLDGRSFSSFCELPTTKVASPRKAGVGFGVHRN